MFFVNSRSKCLNHGTVLINISILVSITKIHISNPHTTVGWSRSRFLCSARIWRLPGTCWRAWTSRPRSSWLGSSGCRWVWHWSGSLLSRGLIWIHVVVKVGCLVLLTKAVKHCCCLLCLFYIYIINFSVWVLFCIYDGRWMNENNFRKVI